MFQFSVFPNSFGADCMRYRSLFFFSPPAHPDLDSRSNWAQKEGLKGRCFVKYVCTRRQAGRQTGTSLYARCETLWLLRTRCAAGRFVYCCSKAGVVLVGTVRPEENPIFVLHFSTT